MGMLPLPDAQGIQALEIVPAFRDLSSKLIRFD